MYVVNNIEPAWVLVLLGTLGDCRCPGPTAQIWQIHLGGAVQTCRASPDPPGPLHAEHCIMLLVYSDVTIIIHVPKSSRLSLRYFYVVKGHIAHVHEGGRAWERG